MIKIKDQYPELAKYTMDKLDDDFKVPEGMVELIKQWVPLHMCVALKWGKRNSEQEREQSRLLSDQSAELASRILAYDFHGMVTLVVNKVPLVMEIYYDEESERKEIKWHDTTVVSFDFEWEK